MRPQTRVVMLTSYADERLAMEAVDAGASGFLLKDASPRDVVSAIRAAHRGEAVLHPAVAAKLLAERRRPPAAHADLTPRELEVLRLIARGLQNKGIAAELHLSEKTVKTHVSAILRKLDVTDRTQAAMYAVREGWPSPAEPRDDVGGVPIWREDRIEDVLDPSGSGDERDPAVERIPAISNVGRSSAARAEIRIGDQRIRDVLARGELRLVGERLGRHADDVRPRAASSARWSRNAHDCGVQPLAPESHPSRPAAAPGGGRCAGRCRGRAFPPRRPRRSTWPAVDGSESAGSSQPGRWSAAPSSSGTGRSAGRICGSNAVMTRGSA